jgi:hypothetical protein
MVTTLVAFAIIGVILYSCEQASHDEGEPVIAPLTSTPPKQLTMKAGQPACLTGDLLSQLSKAITDQDANAIGYLSENGCIVTKGGVPVTILESGTFGLTVHVRGYMGKHTADVWVYRDAINGLEPQSR